MCSHGIFALGENMSHLSDRDLKGLLEGRLTAKVRQRVVRHLLSRCEECPSRLRALFSPDLLWTTSSPGTEDAYDRCIDRAIAKAYRAAAEEQERQDRGMVLVRSKGWSNLTSSERRVFQGRWSQVEILLDLSFELRYRDRRGMLELALSAERAADRLKPTAAFGEQLLLNLRARVAAEVANAERVNERFLRAENALKKARSLLGQGSGDLMIQARVDEVEATLRKAQRRLDEAEDLLCQASRAYLKLGERHLAGRAIMTKGICRFVAGQPLEAARFHREALDLLDPARDPQLMAATQHNLLDALVEAGKILEARKLFLESGLRLKFADDPLNLLRIRWVEGKILAAGERHADAERIFAEVRDGFRAEGLELVAAVAGLDLAKIVLRQDRLDQAYKIAEELLARAEQCRLPQAAQRALHSFETMCEVKVAKVANAERVQRFLSQLERRPSLQWEPKLILNG
jgi:tetratricopeptide (TPR) repeat protein